MSNTENQLANKTNSLGFQSGRARVTTRMKPR
jgi:hypothetical protein